VAGQVVGRLVGVRLHRLVEQLAEEKVVELGLVFEQVFWA